MLAVVPTLEARFANLHLWADQALQLRLVDYLALAASAPEGTVRLHLSELADRHVRLAALLSLLSLLLQSHPHLFSVVLGGLLEVVERVASPADTAERASDLLRARLLVLDPSLHAVSVEVAAAAELAVGQVLLLAHRLVANAACLRRLERPLLDPVPLLLESVRSAQDVVDLIVYVPEAAIVLAHERLGLLVQGPLGRNAASSRRPPLVRIAAADSAVAAFEYLLDLSVVEGQLPDQWVRFVDLEDPDQREDCVHAVLGAAAAAAALDLASDLDFELPAVLVLDGQLGRPVLLDKEESLAECAVVVVHELLEEGGH